MLPLLALFACSQPAPPAGELIFVRDAVVAPGGDGAGRALPRGGRLVDRAWTAGEVVTLDGLTATAPRRAECVTVFQVDLGDVGRLIAMGGENPDTSLAFSPDDRWLAIGSYRGDVLVVDAWTGAVRSRRHLSETLVRSVAWAADGATLFAAEQSPDAALNALDPATLESRWTLRLADLVGTSTPPAAEDLYGVYALPAAYGLTVLPEGDLVVAAAHGWTDADGARRNLSQVLRVSTEGSIVARWPAEPADATLLHPAVDSAGGLVAVAVSRSADGPAPDDLPIGGVQVLSLPDLVPVLAIQTDPLMPWFPTPFIWEALDVSRADDAVLMGYGDGRLRVVGLDGTERLARDTGAPIMAGDVPVHTSIGWGHILADTLLYTTSSTLIPWGAAAPELRPPSAHPNENTLFAIGLDGEPRWTWTGPQRIQGLTPAADGRHIVVGAGSRQSDHRRDLYGALVFDPDAPPAADHLVAFCPTEGPAFFNQATTRDGRIAVAEAPFVAADGTMHGSYRATVLR